MTKCFYIIIIIVIIIIIIISFGVPNNLCYSKDLKNLDSTGDSVTIVTCK